MTTAATIWCGPVNAKRGSNLRWPGSTVIFQTCSRSSRPTCAELGRQPLAEVTRADAVYLAAYADGGDLAKAWLGEPRVRGVYLADAVSDVDPRLVDLVVKAARDPSYRVVVTANHARSATLEGIARAAEARGVGWNLHHPSPELVTLPGGLAAWLPGRTVITLGGIDLKDARMWSQGGAYLLDLGRSVTEAQHLSVVAPVLWPRLFTGTEPLYAQPAAPPERSATWTVFVVLGAAAGLAGLAFLLTPSKEPRDA